MVIIEKEPISMAEVVDLAGESDKEEGVKSFIKSFNKMDPKKAREMIDELKGLEIIKLKDAHIVKIVDFKPSDSQDLSKLIDDVSLDQEETSKILDVVKKY